MARIGILALYATGHVNPSLALARALQFAGHEVVFLNLPDNEEAARRAGIRFIPFGENDYPLGALKPIMMKAGELSGSSAIAYYIERMIRFFHVCCSELPIMLHRETLDLLVVDQLLCAGATLAEFTGIPFVSLANALLVNREPTIPPPSTSWPYDPTPSGIARNSQGWANVDQTFEPLLREVNKHRVAWGFPAYTNLFEDSFSPILQLAQQPAVFDFPRPEAPKSLYQVGHFQNGDSSDDDPFPWEWLSEKQALIYASCGTIQNRLEHVFRTMINACASLSAQIVIALGKDAFPPEHFGVLPPNVKLVSFAPQRRLLERATAAIHHGGLNTTLDCLDHAVPAVAIPITSDQPGIGRRLAHVGAGVVIPLAELTAERLASAIQDVLQSSRYRDRARSIAGKINVIDPAVEAVRLIENVISSARR